MAGVIVVLDVLWFSTPAFAVDRARTMLKSPRDVIRLSGVGVYAHPAGHPLCGGWGHPTRDALTTLVADRLERGDLCPNV
jgi:hypothetical protein